MGQTINATIHPHLMIGDHGMLILYFQFKTDTTEYGLGTWGLEYRPNGRWIGEPESIPLISEALRVAGRESWDRLNGTYVRINLDDRGRVQAFGHILHDRWYNPQKILEINDGKQQ